MEIALIIIVVVLLGVVIFLLFKQNSSTKLEDVVKKSLPDLLKSTNEQLVLMANEKLTAEKKEIRADLEGKRDEIQRLIKNIQDDLKDNKNKLGEAEKERVNMFSSVKTSLEEYKKVTEQLSVSTEGLKKVLSDNKVRGRYGETVADNLLKMAGFVIGRDYVFNKEQKGTETRPDFTLYLPDGTKINVDAKFPYSNLQNAAEATDEKQKKEYRALFEQDIKQKIKQVIGRDYINPEDRTVDFVLLFIPNEMIFSYIYENKQEVWEDALNKKVVFVGPFSFTALLRMIKQSYENFRVQQNIQQIVTYVRSLEKEFGKFSEEFEKVGDRIDSLSKQYNEVSRTRVNQINKVMEKVKLEEGEKVEQPKLLD